MQVFEFHFNPFLKRPPATLLARGETPDLIFDSFCYEPENIYERRLGSLYMVGLLKNVLPHNLRFLEKLSKIIKEKYYKYTLFNPEKSLKESLKETNEFLEQIAKKGDVSWLGNFSFAVISAKNFNLNFTKVGDIKILLLRGKKIIDIDKKLRFQDIEPYPLKIFGNIVSGKFAEGDLILVCTKEVFSAFAEGYGGSAVARHKASGGGDFFQEENLINEIAKLEQFSIKGVRGILNGKKEILSKISGICLAIVLKKEFLVGKRELISSQILKEFSFKEVFSPFLKYLRRFKKPRLPEPQRRMEMKANSERGKLLRLPSLKLRERIPPSLKFPKIKIRLPQISFGAKRKVILILALTFILILGFVFAKFEEEKKIKIYQNNLNEIQNKLNLAESYLILENPQIREKANSLLKESFENISSLLKEVKGLPKYFQDEVFALNDKILNKLSGLNKLEKIETPELFFEFKSDKYIPQKFLIFNNNLYFFSPYAKNLFKLDENKKEEILSIDKKFNLGGGLEDAILFLTKPNQLTILKEKEFFTFSLQEPYPDFSFDDFSSFNKNLYFLDEKAGEMIKYPHLKNFEWGSPQTKKVTGAESLAVDGNIWFLNKDNSISQYQASKVQQVIKLDIFPPPKDFSKIFTSPSLAYLFLLEPAQKRIVILNKNGEIFKQFQSEKFDNLLDFAISNDGKTIYLLNGLKVYQIKI